MANFFVSHSTPLGRRIAQTALLVIPVLASGCAAPWRFWRRDEPSLEQLLTHPAPWDAEMRRKDDATGSGRSIERADGARPNPYSTQRTPTTQRSRDSQEKFTADAEDFTEADFQAAYAAAPPALRELLKRQWEATQLQRKEAVTTLASVASQSPAPSAADATGSRTPSSQAAEQAPASFRLSDTAEASEPALAKASPSQPAARLPGNSDSSGMTRYDLRESPAPQPIANPAPVATRQLEGLKPPPARPQVEPATAVQPIDTGYAEDAALTRAATGRLKQSDQSQVMHSVAIAGGSAGHASTRRESEVMPASVEQRVNSHPSDSSLGDRSEPALSSNQKSEELDWRDHVREAIRLLEDQQVDLTRKPVESLNTQATARMLQLAVNDLEGALRPITGLQSHEQEYFRHALQALHDATDLSGNPVLARRWTLALDSHRQALAHLSAVSNLEIKNATFCTDVQSYGVISKFPSPHFRPSQELLLYCELDNFVAEPVKEGFETQLQGSYEILDADGRRVTDVLLPVDSDVCRHQRRDYFIAYRIYMPQQIAKGRYQLRLTIEDMKGRKFGQSTLDFQIAQ